MNLTTKSGKTLHPIGIGTWNLASRIDPDQASNQYKGVVPVYGNEDKEIEGIRYSMSKGQNHIDCAELYGGFYTDEVVGRALHGHVREDLFVADKLWKISVDPCLVRPKVEQMLKKLGTDYLDMLYIHAPWANVDWQAAIPQIDELIDEGIVRHFGVSNFTITDLQLASKLAKHPVAANQMNFNVLYKDEIDATFLAFCREKNIEVVAYQPIKRGAVLEDELLNSIAMLHHATPAQVALAWLLQQNYIPIPKATDKAHIDENLGALKIQLTDEEIDKLNKY